MEKIELLSCLENFRKNLSKKTDLQDAIKTQISNICLYVEQHVPGDIVDMTNSNIGLEYSQAIKSFINNNANWLVMPASTTVHSAFEGGLAVHSIGVYEASLRCSEIYGVKFVNPIACLFHDACKIGNYVKIWDSKKKFHYEYNKNSIGISHGAESLRRLLTSDSIHKELLPEAWQLAVAYHMGVYGLDQFQCREFNAAAKAHPEVLLLHHADMIASQLYEE